MPEVELCAGTIEYEDTGGDGPILVLLHGVAIDGSLWRHVAADLREGHRCVVPTLPLGAHRRPMRPDADLSLLGMVRLVAELLEKLDLGGVTLVGNDWGGAQLLISEGLDGRVGRLVLVSCEAFENYPPGVPGRAVARAASIPGGIFLAFQSLRLRLLRRLPMTWGWMSKRPVPHGVMDEWFRPLQTRPEIRRDLRKYALSIPSKEMLLEWSERLRSFDRPALSGPGRIASCPRSTAVGWRTCFRGDDWSRCPTATRLSPRISPENLPAPFATLYGTRHEPVSRLLCVS